jgi:hypothetical protein
MKTRLSYFLGPLLCLCVATCANAQIMTPHYVTAFTQTIDSTGTIGTITMTTTGYATVAPGVPPSTRHTPSACVTIDAVGGCVYGTPVCASCNVYAVKSISATFDDQTDSCFLGGDDPTTGCYFDVNTNGQVVCTMAGNLFTGGTNDYHSVSVSFAGTPVVPMGGTAAILATVINNPNLLTIKLTLSTAQGTSGSALFLGNSQTTMTITGTTSLAIVGTQSSSVPGNILLNATVTVDSHITTIGSTNFTVDTTNGAIPTNFRQVNVNQQSNGVLQFVYEWDSSTGNPTDLRNCSVGEIVTYPTQSQNPGFYYWASPPYQRPPDYDFSSPYISLVAADNVLISPYNHTGSADLNRNPGFLRPYKADNFADKQVYRFQCTYYKNNSWINMTGPIIIQRVVSPNNDKNNTWRYDITKSGSLNSVNPLP